MADKVVPVDVRSLIVAWPDDAGWGAVTRFCREHQVSRSQFYEIRGRAVREGQVAAMAPKPAVPPVRHPMAVPLEIEELAVRLRKQLQDDGWAHGPISVRHALADLGVAAPAASTLARIFTRRGMVSPQPQKRPRSSYRRFQAEAVHECWQIDGYQWQLADGTVFTIIQVIDDRSRYPIVSRACPGERATEAIAAIRTGIERFQVPCRVLSDNGSAFNQDRLGKRTQLVTMLLALGCKPVTGKPGHPQTQGKNERAHQTQQRWLRARPAPADLPAAQALLDEYDQAYAGHRHQGLGMATPAQVLAQGPIAVPPAPPEQPPPAGPTAPRAGRVTVSATGAVSVGQATVINVGSDRRGQRLTTVTHGHVVTVFGPDGLIIRTVHLEPGRRYYGNGKPRGPRPAKPKRPD